MSHNVETMAYTGQVPWHGLGVKVDKAPSVKEMLKLAKLDWTVERRPLIYTTDDFVGQLQKKNQVSTKVEADRIVEGFAALVRNIDGRVLDVVGSKYVPTQNAEAFEFFNDFVQAGDAKMETAGSLQGGKYVWGLARLGDEFKLKGNDTVKGYLLACCPHQQGKSALYKTTAVRVVCNNTYNMALREGGDAFRFVHRQKFTKDIIKQAKETLGLAREQFSEFKAQSEKLMKIKLDMKDCLEVLRPVFTPQLKVLVEDEAPPKIKAIMQAYQHAPGALPGTGWGLLNAVTYWADHMASRTPDKRLSNAWFGKTSNQKTRVMEALLA